MEKYSLQGKDAPGKRAWKKIKEQTPQSTMSSAATLACGDETQKRGSFLTNERKFLGPLMRFVRGDVRDHIVTPKIDHGSS